MIQFEPHRITGHRTVVDRILIGGIWSTGTTQYRTVLVEEEQLRSIGIGICGPFSRKACSRSDLYLGRVYASSYNWNCFGLTSHGLTISRHRR